MPDNSFAEFLDSFRKSRNMSRTEFVEGIVSTRQYQRFIKGQSSLSSDVITKLMDRLEIDSNSVIQSFSKASDAIYQLLKVSYNHLSQSSLKEANKIISEIDPDSLDNVRNTKLYNLVKNILLIKQKRITEKTGMNNIIKLIDYPNILNKTSLSYIEGTGLISISNYLLKNGDNRIGMFSYERIKEESNNNLEKINDLSLLFYIKSAQALGHMGNFEESLDVTNIGIAKYMSDYGLDTLYILLYSKALGEKHSLNDDTFKKTLKRLFALLYVEQNNKRLEQYCQFVKKTFHLDPNEFILFK